MLKKILRHVTKRLKRFLNPSKKPQQFRWPHESFTNLLELYLKSIDDYEFFNIAFIFE